MKTPTTIVLPHGTFVEDTLENLVRAAGYDYRHWVNDTVAEVKRAQSATVTGVDHDQVAVAVTLSRVHRMLNQVK